MNKTYFRPEEILILSIASQSYSSDTTSHHLSVFPCLFFVTLLSLQCTVWHEKPCRATAEVHCNNSTLKACTIHMQGADKSWLEAKRSCRVVCSPPSSLYGVSHPKVLCGQTRPDIQQTSCETHCFSELLREGSLSLLGPSARALERRRFFYSLLSLISKSQTTNTGLCWEILHSFMSHRAKGWMGQKW